MSALNNRGTLEHYLGKVWLTRPRAFAPGDTAMQGINVCVEEKGDFYAVDYLRLSADGVYHNKAGPLGRREDGAFRQYMEKLAGANGKSEADLFQQVCDCYAACGDVAAVAGALGLSKDRVRRILITKGAYTDELVANIAWLHDGGRGKTVAEIAEILRISPTTVHKNMAYGKAP